MSRDVEVFDVTFDSPHEMFLYGCLAPMPSRKYRRRSEYLEAAVRKGFHKKILAFKGEVVGQIEYAPPEASGYPIMGRNIVVMNCIWVLRRVKGHRFGDRLVRGMKKTESDAVGFATIGLEGHWSPWVKLDQLEKLGFRSIDHVCVSHRIKRTDRPFKVHLMWLPVRKNAEPPTWDKKKLLEGVYFCKAHPLYHPQTHEQEEILKQSKS